jgi:hypothetical protein
MAKKEKGNIESTKKKTSVAWSPFCRKLTTVLEALDEDQFLIISEKQSGRFVQFAGQGAFGLRVETVSNHYLKKQERLDPLQRQALKNGGWNAPTGKPKKATPERDPDGSPNYFIDFEAPVSFRKVAKLAATTLNEILRVPSPIFLEYDAFDATGTPVHLPALGLKRSEKDAPPSGTAELKAQVLKVLRATTEIADLDPDEDGDITLQYGAATVFTTVMGERPCVRIFSPVLPAAKESPALLAKLNSINDGIHWLRFFFRDGSVYAVTDVQAEPLIDSHLSRSLQEFCMMADGMAISLQAEFGDSTGIDWRDGCTTVQ